jgi:acyl-coenzyme A thioesterase PaaI-like protein
VAGAVNALGAKIIGVKGSGTAAELQTDMEELGKQTGSVNGAGVPYVYSGADAAAGAAIAAAVRELTSTLPLDLSVTIEDDPSDAVEAVAAFVDHIETFTPGTAECQAWPDQHDSNADGRNDEYLGVPPGFPVCWKIVVKQNDTVPATGTVQIFKAVVKLRGNISTLLDTRTVYFVVPPDLSIPG